MSPPNIHDAPKIPDHCTSDAHEREQADHLASQRTRQARTSSEQPEPPGIGEFAVSLLVEFDVGEDGEGHEKDESRVQEDQAGLGDVTVV